MSVDIDRTVIHEHCEPALIVDGIELCPATRLTLYLEESGDVYCCKVPEGEPASIVRLDGPALAAIRAHVP